MLGPRVLRALVLTGYALVFLWVFSHALIWSFPYPRFHDSLEQLLSRKLGRRVDVAELRGSITGKIVLEGVEIEIPSVGEERPGETPAAAEAIAADTDPNAPKKPATPRLSYFLEKATIEVGLWDLLLGELDVVIEAELMEGDLRIVYEGPLPSDENPEQPLPLAFELELEDASLALLHELRQTLPLPIAGQWSVSIEVESSSGLLAEAVGTATFHAKDVVVGEKGKTIEIGGQAITVVPLAIADLEAQMTIDKGKGRIAQVTARSEHLALRANGGIELKDPLERSEFDFYFMIEILGGYLNQSERTKALFARLEDESPQLRRSMRRDGSYGFRYRGPWGQGRLLGSHDFRPRHQEWIIEEREHLRDSRLGKPEAPVKVDNRPLAERFGIVGRPPGAPVGMSESPIQPPPPPPELEPQAPPDEAPPAEEPQAEEPPPSTEEQEE
jgi:type II secretion system protein N